MRFSSAVLDKAKRYKNIGYLCESFEHLPLALALIYNFPNVKLFSTSDYIIDYLKSIGVNGSKIKLADINSCMNPLQFIPAVYRLKAETKEVIELLRSNYLLTSSARVSVSLFHVFDSRRNDIAFIGWEGIDWSRGKRLSGKPDFISWKSYLILRVRQLLYWVFISFKIQLREFSGEIFLTYVNGFEYYLEIEEREGWIKRYVEICGIKKNIPNKKIIFLLGQSYISDSISFGRERVNAIFSILQNYRDFVLLKIHPGSSCYQYFGNCNDIFLDCYDEDLPIEVLATPADLIVSFGSSGLVNTSNLGIHSLCVGRVGEYPAGNLGGNYFQHFLKANSNYYSEITQLNELKFLLGAFGETKV